MAQDSFAIAEHEDRSGAPVDHQTEIAELPSAAFAVIIDPEKIADQGVFLSYLERMRAYVLSSWTPN